MGSVDRVLISAPGIIYFQGVIGHLLDDYQRVDSLCTWQVRRLAGEHCYHSNNQAMLIHDIESPVWGLLHYLSLAQWNLVKLPGYRIIHEIAKIDQRNRGKAVSGAIDEQQSRAVTSIDIVPE